MNRRPLLRCASILPAAVLISLVGCSGLPQDAQVSGSSSSAGNVESASLSDPPLGIDGEVVRGQLENGLTYYVRKNGKPSERVQLRLVANAGSVLERENERGLAHFVEHMAFNGTEGYDRNSIVDYLEKVGMSFGPDINAYTSFDETVYSLDLPADSAETLEKGFDILREWASRIAFDPEEVEKERGVIVEEWRSGRGAGARLRDKWWPVLVKGSRYAERLPVGLMDVVKNAPASRLEDFYRRWYRPDLMAVVVVGDIEEGRAVDLIEKNFSGRFGEDGVAEDGVAEDGRPRYEVPSPKKRRVVVAKDPEASNVHVRIIYLKKPFVPRTEKDYKLSLAMRLYQMMVSMRLSEIARGEDPPIINGYFSRGPLVREKDAAFWGAVAYEGRIDTALRVLAEEERRVELFGFTEGELERAKRNLRTSVETAYRERGKTESSRYVSEYLKHFLSGEAAPGIDKEWRMVQEMLPEIDRKLIDRIRDHYMLGEDRVVVITGPEKEGLAYPDREKIDGIFRELAESAVSPYSDDFEGRSLLPEKPEKGSIVSEEHEGTGDFYRLKLENGATVVYKRTEFKNDEILFSAFSEGGRTRVETENYYTARLAPSLVSACGLGDFTPMQLEKLLSGTRVSLRPYIDRHFEGFSGNAAPKDLELLFQQLYLYYTKVREDEGLFRSYRERLASSVKNRRSSPRVQYQDEISRLLFDDHPRMQPIESEIVDSIEMEETFRIFRRRFVDPGSFTYFFVGNVEEEKIREYARTYLASLPEGRGETWQDRGVNFTDTPGASDVYAGQEPKSRVTMIYTGDCQWSPERKHALSALKELLRIRLREVVREDAGGTYGVSVTASAKRFPRQEYALLISFSCAPDRVSELTSIVGDELLRIRSEAQSPEYAEKIREKQRSDWEEAQEENSYWLGQLSSSHRYGIQMDRLLARGERIERVDPDMLKQTAQDFLKNAVELKVILYPESENQ